MLHSASHCLPFTQEKAVAAAVADAVATAKEEGDKAAAEAVETARAAVAKAAAEEAAGTLLDLVYLGTVRRCGRVRRWGVQQHRKGTPIERVEYVGTAEWELPAGGRPAARSPPWPGYAASPTPHPHPACDLQTFDVMTRTPLLAHMAQFERASFVGYAQHFGVALTGAWMRAGHAAGWAGSLAPTPVWLHCIQAAAAAAAGWLTGCRRDWLLLWEPTNPLPPPCTCTPSCPCR